MHIIYLHCKLWPHQVSEGHTVLVHLVPDNNDLHIQTLGRGLGLNMSRVICQQSYSWSPCPAGRRSSRWTWSHCSPAARWSPLQYGEKYQILLSHFHTRFKLTKLECDTVTKYVWHSMYISTSVDLQHQKNNLNRKKMPITQHFLFT